MHIFLRNHAAADSAADRAIALAPTSAATISLKVLVAVARGELDSARAVIRASEARMHPGALYAFFASYQDLYWILDDAQQRQVLSAPPAAFDGDRGVWGLVRTQIYHDRGEVRLTRAYADSARLALEEQVRATPEDGQRRVLLGLALAFLGRKADAVREGTRGAALMPISRDGYLGPYVQLQLARIYLLTGEPDRAMDQLEPLLSIPFYLTPAWLRNDPAFKPLRERPRFRALVSGVISAAPDTVVVLMADAAAAGGAERRNRVQLDLLEGEGLHEAAAGLTALRTHPRVDPRRLALAGHSFGGSLALLLAARDTAVRATVVFGTAARSWNSSSVLRERLLDAARRAPPVLLLQAANDYSVTPGEALAAEMTRAERPHRLRIYPPVGHDPGNGHNLIYRNVGLWEADVFDFLDHYLHAGG